ncbi:MAG: class III signal peptide-containing protein [Candidatus Diapherotrites archaeon]|nr:class III signal peptide-containing protein [Candidatus Diapherotrites archaeon]
MAYEKGQGALEYLILIGAAMVVVLLVITVILPTAGKQQCENDKTIFEATCSAKPNENLCQGSTLGPDLDNDNVKDCAWQNNRCVAVDVPSSCS